MTTKWYSAKERMQYCKLCNVWLDNSARAMRTHEEGKKHKELAEAHMKKMNDDRKKKGSEEDFLKKELDAIENLAKQRHEQVDILGIDITSATGSNHNQVALTKPRHHNVSLHPPRHQFHVAVPPAAASMSSEPSDLTRSGYNEFIGSKVHLPISPDSEAAGTEASVKAPVATRLPPGIKASTVAREKQELPEDTAKPKESEESSSDNFAETTDPIAMNTTSSLSSSDLTLGDIDENTGFGKWELVAPAGPSPQATPQELLVQDGRIKGRKRMKEAENDETDSSSVSAFGGSNLVKQDGQSREAEKSGEAFDENDIDEIEARRKLSSDEDVVQDRRSAFDASALFDGEDPSPRVEFKKKKKKIATADES